MKRKRAVEEEKKKEMSVFSDKDFEDFKKNYVDVHLKK